MKSCILSSHYATNAFLLLNEQTRCLNLVCHPHTRFVSDFIFSFSFETKPSFFLFWDLNVYTTTPTMQIVHMRWQNVELHKQEYRHQTTVDFMKCVYDLQYICAAKILHMREVSIHIYWIKMKFLNQKLRIIFSFETLYMLIWFVKYSNFLTHFYTTISLDSIQPSFIFGSIMKHIHTWYNCECMIMCACKRQ